MKPCRECQHEVSEQAMACSQCGAPFPAKAKWDGWEFTFTKGMDSWLEVFGSCCNIKQGRPL